MRININPKNYIKLFNIKQDVLLTHYFEVVLRQNMRKYGLPNVECIYIDGQFYYNKYDIAKYNLSNQRILKVIKKLRRFSKYYINFCAKIKDKKFTKLSWKELINFFKKFVKFLADFFAIIDVIVYFEHFFEPGVIKKLKKCGFNENDFDILSTPLYESYHKRRHLDFIRLKLREITKDEFVKRWGWSNMAIFHCVPVDDEFIKESLKEIKNPGRERKEIVLKTKEEKANFNKLYKKLSVSLKKDADLMQELIAARDYRFEALIKGCYCAINLLSEIGTRLNLSYQEVTNMTPNEIINKKIPTDLRKRLGGFACIGDKIYTGEELKKLWNLFNQKQEAEFVKGTPASRGMVRGKARIILKPDELDRLEKGDVLICEMTTPDYLVGAKRAGAIVTNIGGLTCHAAIISREFGIPCVIGTGNATLVFKDGDLVEVDANKGIVKILKR